MIPFGLFISTYTNLPDEGNFIPVFLQDIVMRPGSNWFWKSLNS